MEKLPVLHRARLIACAHTMPGGRVATGVWRCYDKWIDDKHNVKATCKGCDLVMGGIAIRMRSHAKKCVPLKDSGLTSDLELSSDSEKETPVEEPPKKRQKRQLILNVQRTNSDAMLAINHQITRMIVSSNAPFAIVENKEFQRLMDMLRPGLKISDRHTISGFDIYQNLDNFLIHSLRSTPRLSS